MFTASLPDDIDELKAIIAELATYKEKSELLEEENKRLRAKLFSSKSEKPTAEDKSQAVLFNEIEEQEAQSSQTASEEASTSVKAHTRKKKTGRKPFADDIPRIDVVHEIPEKERVCACGTTRSKIGEEISEKIDIIPAKVRVKRHVRHKYACKNCEGTADESNPTVITAPKEKHIIDKCLATAGFLAHVITAKFVDHMPFYRLEKILYRIGIEVGRATMCNWAKQIAIKCNRLIKLMAVEALSGPLVAIDETTAQVLKERGRSPTKKAYMWVARGTSAGKPIILYRYRRRRSAQFLKRLLRKFKGVMQTDGFESYDKLAEVQNLEHAGCWAHVRRKFFEVTKIAKRKKVAGIALDLIGQLYAVEKEARESSLAPGEIVNLRQQKSKPVVEKFREFLDSKANITPKSAMGKAITYACNEWPKLLIFLKDGNVPIDNNLVENAIRPFVLGRKNWMFSDTVTGARSSAIFYSLIETAKANGLEPYWYLRYLFENLPMATNDEQLKALMPTRLSAEVIGQKTPVD